jgi:hypothetical protein
MKKLFLAAGLIGILNFAHASNTTTLTLDSGTAIDGLYAYEYLVSATLAPNTQITSASLVFTGIKLTSAGNGDDISYDIINRADANTRFSDNDAAGDYFTSTSPYKSTAVSLGKKNFNVGQTQSWTYTFTTATLAILNSYLADNGKLDIGIDPDCYYTVGSICFTYTTGPKPKVPVPDVASTAILLGAAFSTLSFLRRKSR